MSKHYSFKRASPEVTPVSGVPMILVGVGIHCSCLVATFCVAAAASKSNIWPIAAVLGAAIVMPVSVMTGTLTGWIVERRRLAAAIPILILTGVGVAGTIIAVLSAIADRE